MTLRHVQNQGSQVHTSSRRPPAPPRTLTDLPSARALASLELLPVTFMLATWPHTSLEPAGFLSPKTQASISETPGAFMRP